MKTVVLAAGKGSRLESEAFELPKALRSLDSRPLISYVLDGIGVCSDIIVVIGFEGDRVRGFVSDYTGGRAAFAVQEEQNGTAHAVLAVEKAGVLDGYDGDVMVVYCDMPLITRETYSSVARFHEGLGAEAGFTLLTARIEPPPPYGRIVRDSFGRVCGVVEERNASASQKLISEVNVGVQVANWDLLRTYLHKITNENPQKEYILTEAATIMARDGLEIGTVETSDTVQAMGVNTMDELRACEEIIRLRRGGA